MICKYTYLLIFIYIYIYTYINCAFLEYIYLYIFKKKIDKPKTLLMYCPSISCSEVYPCKDHEKMSYFELVNYYIFLIIQNVQNYIKIENNPQHKKELRKVLKHIRTSKTYFYVEYDRIVTINYAVPKFILSLLSLDGFEATIILGQTCVYYRNTI